jgi:hypothetical protein
LVAGVVVSTVVAHRNRGIRRLMAESSFLACCFVGVTAGFMLASRALLHATNIFDPTFDALDQASSGSFISFHSTTWRWIDRETQLFVAPLLLVVWGALRLGRLRRTHGYEKVVASAVVLQLAIFFVIQARDGSTLENYQYSSLLWGSISLLTVIVTCALWDQASARAGELVVLGAVLLVPVAVHFVADDPTYFAWPWAPMMIATVALVALVVRRTTSPGASRAPLVAGAATVIVLGLAFSLTIAKPQDLPFLPGQAVHPQAQFGAALFNPDDRFVDFYRNASKLIELEPKIDVEPGPLAAWWPARAGDMVQVAAATELWRVTSINFGENGLPELTQQGVDAVRAWNLRFVLMLGDDASAFDRGAEALAAAGFSPRIRWEHELRQGDVAVAARLVELGSWKQDG